MIQLFFYWHSENLYLGVLRGRRLVFGLEALKKRSSSIPQLLAS